MFGQVGDTNIPSVYFLAKRLSSARDRVVPAAVDS
jgi:hypothetical protein